MGSRITRAIYQKQRKAPIKAGQEQSVQLLVVAFIAFMNCIFFFLFGFLFRPHLNNRNSIGVFFLLFVLFTIIKLKQISRATIIASVCLCLGVTLSWLFSVDLMFLKATLILTSVTLSAVVGLELEVNAFFQSFLLWLLYEFFGLGVTLSLSVEKITFQTNNVALGRQESMLAQVIFGLIGIMIIILTTVGKRLIKKKTNVINKHMALKQQIISVVLNLVIFIAALAFKRSIQHFFIPKLIACIASIIIVLSLNHFKTGNFVWIFVTFLFILAHVLQWISEYQSITLEWTNSLKAIAINLIIIDSLVKWISSVNSGNHRPLIIAFIYFTAVYICQLSQVGIIIYQSILPIVIQIIIILMYGLAHLYDRMNRRDNYEEVVV